MSEDQNQSDSAVAVADEPAEINYNVTVTDAGPALKKVSVEIPADVIKSKLDEQMKELRREANIPGFRIGHAPQALIKKKFGTELKEQVRRTLIGESYEQAVEKNNLQVIGEPVFADAAEIKLPDSGPLTYTFEVEVQPEMTLPSLTGIPVKKPKVQVKDENVDQAMKNLREQQGTLVPVEDRGVEAGDYLTADVKLTAGEADIVNQPDVSIVARAARLAGIEVPDLVNHLAGAKSGDTKTFTAKGPDNHPEEKVRGQDVTFAVTIKDIKKLELVEITPEFLEELGFENEAELRDALREQMVERIEFDIAQNQRQQISKYLAENTQVELPAKLSSIQADRVTQRRAMELIQRGIPQDQLMAQIDTIRAGSAEEGARELKMFFILQKIGVDMDIDVTEPELNGRIAMLAAQRGERPETMKQQMTKDGSLQNLYIQMKEEKTLDEVLKSAAIEEVEPPAADAAAEVAPQA